jgi:hypothetical protein
MTEASPNSASSTEQAKESHVYTLAPPVGQGQIQKVNFTINNFSVERDLTDVPSTTKEFAELAMVIPGSSKLGSSVQVVAVMGVPNRPQELLILSDRESIKSFWKKVASCPEKSTSITVTNEGKTSKSPYQYYTGVVLLVLLAVLCPAFAPFLPTQMRAVARLGRQLSENYMKEPYSSEKPKDQMTDFALATIQSVHSGDNSERHFLESMVMQDARTYSKAVVFEAQSDNKQDAVVSALANTNLDPNVSKKIGALVGNTTMLVDQFTDFIYDDNGKATTFTVNLWVSPEKSDKKVEVALMVCGASFRKALVKAVEEVEEPQYRDTFITHPPTWRSDGYVEHIREPITYDGVTPVVRKVSRPVFDQTTIKANEMEVLRSYLMTLASHDTLRNYAPRKIPELVGSRLHRAKVLTPVIQTTSIAAQEKQENIAAEEEKAESISAEEDSSSA